MLTGRVRCWHLSTIARSSSSGTNRRPSWVVNMVWLTCMLLLSSPMTTTTCEASVWSYFSGGANEESTNNNNNNIHDDNMVSPIVNREIQVSVKAPWPSSSQHSVLCEAFVFLRDYAFLDALVATHGRDHLVTFQRSTRYALELAAAAKHGNAKNDKSDSDNNHSQHTSLLKVALTMRAMAPTCELHRSLAQDRYSEYVEYLEAFGVIPQPTDNGSGGEAAKETILQTSEDIPESAIDLPVLTRAERDTWLLPNEVIRKGKKTIDDTGGKHATDDDKADQSFGFVILYARLGGHSFPTFYRRLVELEIPFVVRHMGDPEQDQPETVLQGFGVRLDIRNVEYKVFDDKRGSTVDESTHSAMINLTSLGEDTLAGVDAEGADDESSHRLSHTNHLSSHFLAGVNLTALSLHTDSHNGEFSFYDLQRDLWKLHERYEQHSQLIPQNWQRRRLSLQAASVVANSAQPLLTLQDVSQNLPSLASTLIHVTVPEEIEEVAGPMEKDLQNLMHKSGGGLWINGRPMNVERPSFNVFEMIKLLQKEAVGLEELQSKLRPLLKQESAVAGLKEIQRAWIQGDINKDDSGDTNDEEDDDDGGVSRKGQYRIDLATGDAESVIYLNDLEKDRCYHSWSTSVEQMLMAMQYGMPPSIRRNLFTVVIVDDPIGKLDMEQNFGQALIGQLAQQGFPARLAVVTASKDDIAACAHWIRSEQPKDDQECPVEKDHWLRRDDPPTSDELKEIRATARDVHRLYSYMRAEFADKGEALIPYELFLGPSLQKSPPINGEFYSLYELFAIHNDIAIALHIANSKTPIEEVARLLQENEADAKHSYGKAVRFAVDKGIEPGMSFINGRPLPTDADDAEKLQTIFVEEQQLVFGMIVNKQITDTTPRNFYNKLIKGKKANVFPRLHPLLSSASEVFIDVSHNFGADSLLTPQSMTNSQLVGADAIFVFEAALELDKPEGLKYALDFLNIMESITESFVDTSIMAKYRIIPSTVKAAQTMICNILGNAGKVGFARTVEAIQNLINEPDKFGDMEEGEFGSLCSDLSYLREELPSKNFIMANGRVYSPEGRSLDAVDVELLVSMNLNPSMFVTELLKDYIDPDRAFDAVGRTTSFLLAAKETTQVRSHPDDLIESIEKTNGISKNPLRFSWNTESSEEDCLRMSVTAIVDPVTETTQRLVPLLIIIRDELKLPLNLWLAPRMELNSNSNIPISSYYRFVADPSAYQGKVGSPVAQFANLPTDQILTLRMDVPEPWDVQQTYAIQDTDNLRCDIQSGCGDELQNGVDMVHQRHLTTVEYGLEHLLFFGQCYETNMSPPNGLQLILSKHKGDNQLSQNKRRTSVEVDPDGSIHIEAGNEELSDAASESDSHYSDTLVMKTVGYWQLRANPGVWDLQINEKSRGAEIFQMVDGKFKSGIIRLTGTIENNKKRLVMGDFVGGGQLLLVKRKPGYEKASLFYDSNKPDSKDDDVVHVFSLATGHLYERFLKIMMLSVTKRTSTKVKFWLFENFLSPTFKASSLAMAKKIGCEVEFVTYKWPEWLRGQSEKQRIIWGYKILFLDVLFPLNVKKIIYVDSDQVVRGDLKELWDMDLQGAPYGYTPMCSSNEATLGYQFWRQGFWATHLRGKPYHISALYVVDLEKFRKDRVGDSLRAQYQALSADPGSLANLDQDLPNYAQHQVPIFSLPQEWLWCESWCSNETKAEAKTIDLCNNPLHKEPKVSMAKRIISGDLFQESWIELDAEVERYDKEYMMEATSTSTEDL